MLKPEYFNNKEDRLLEIYNQFVNFIYNDIAGRFLKAGEMSGTADRLLYKLRAMGESQQEIQKKLMQLTGLSNLELKALLQDAVLTSFDDDLSTFNRLGIEISSPLENAAVIRIMDAEYKKSLGELSNLTRTTMKQSQIDLMNMMDEAEIRVSSGVQSYSAAACDILDRYAGRGIVIEYPTGAKRTLEAAVRMCVVTSMNQTASQVTNQYIVEAKSEYVLVSAHLGARTQQKGKPSLADHSAWQGKVYRIRGSEPGYPNLLEATGYDIDPETGQGKVVNPLGLHGYNCRHGHQPWDKRLKNPYLDENGNLKIDNEENRKRYELQQKQRAMEREIRKTKRELLMKQKEIDGVAETDIKEMLQPQYDRLAYKLREQNKKYNAFCEENDLQKQYDRIKVSGFKKAQESKANGAATRYENNKKNIIFNSVSDDDIIKGKKEILRRIESGKYSLKLSRQHFLKHKQGTSQYEDYQRARAEKGNAPQSIILIDEQEAQNIINERSGTGIPSIKKSGIGDVEYIECDKVIGMYCKKGQWCTTKRAALHHGKRSSHIVPVEDKR